MEYGGRGGMERELARYGTSMWKDRRDEIKSWEPGVGIVPGWKAGGEGGGGVMEEDEQEEEDEDERDSIDFFAVSTDAGMNSYAYVCRYTYVWIFGCIYMYICIHIYIYIYTCIYVI